MMRWLSRICLVLACVFGQLSSALAIPVVSTDVLASGSSIGRYIEYAFDPTLTADLAQMRAKAPEEWTTHRHEKLSLGFSKEALWIRFSLPPAERSQRWWLTVNYPLLNDLDLYQLDGDRLIRHQRAGTSAVPENAPFLSTRALFVVDTEARQANQFYLRVRTEGSLVVPIQFHTPVSLLDALVIEAQNLGMFFGALSVLFIFHLILLVLFRDRGYLLYTGLILCISLAMALLSGTANRYFIATADESSLRIIPLCLAVSMWMGMMLTREFLGTARQLPRLDTWMRAFSAMSLAPGVITLVFGYYPGVIFVSLLMPLLVVTTFFASARAVREGFGPARYFLAGWGFMVAGSSLYAARALGWVPDNAWTAQSLHIGVGVLMGLVALSMMARFRLHMDQEASRHRKMMEDIRASNQGVEEEVARRSRELDDETARLKATEKALAMQDRRFAAGVMSAGVAHEINNPNNFVNAGAQLYQARLQAFRRMVFDLLDGETTSDIHAQFESRLSLLETRAKAVDDASRRIGEIVNQFNWVTSEGVADSVSVDLIEQLRAALEVPGLALSARLQIDIDFGDVPDVHCNADQFVQAFMTMLGAYAEYTTDEQRQGVVLGSRHDGQRLKLYVSPLLPCMGIRERLGWFEPVMAKQSAAIEWEFDGGLIIILPLSRD